MMLVWTGGILAGEHLSRELVHQALKRHQHHLWEVAALAEVLHLHPRRQAQEPINLDQEEPINLDQEAVQFYLVLKSKVQLLVGDLYHFVLLYQVVSFPALTNSTMTVSGAK